MTARMWFFVRPILKINAENCLKTIAEYAIR